MFNKIPFYRILALFILFSVSLTACTSTPVSVPTAIMPVETPKPSATATESPTMTPTAEPTTESFAPIDLGTPEHFNKNCTVEDYFNGSILASERKIAQPFPEGTTGEWIKDTGNPTIPTPLFQGTTRMLSFCELSGKFLDTVLTGKLFVIGFQVPDVTNDKGHVVHVVFEEKVIKDVLKIYSTGKRVGLLHTLDSSMKQNMEKNKHFWTINLIERNMENGIDSQISALLSKGGSITDNMETAFFVGVIR